LLTAARIILRPGWLMASAADRTREYRRRRRDGRAVLGLARETSAA
jgi:hypothetical protein